MSKLLTELLAFGFLQPRMLAHHLNLSYQCRFLLV